MYIQNDLHYDYEVNEVLTIVCSHSRCPQNYDVI